MKNQFYGKKVTDSPLNSVSLFVWDNFIQYIFVVKLLEMAFYLSEPVDVF
jgi:hypothetical protein